MFVFSLAVGHWNVAVFGAVLIWLSNGIMAAALLQLHRRQAVTVIGCCLFFNLISNVLRGDAAVFVVLNAALNVAEAMLVAILARRVCGAALDMRSPGRLARFALLAALPAVAISAFIAISMMHVLEPVPPTVRMFFLQTYVSVELAGLMLATPALLMLARAHRFHGAGTASRLETAGLFALLIAVTTAVFWQTSAPVLFLVFLPLTLIALRLSPPMTAAAMLVMALIAGLLTLNGYGPIQLTRLSDHPDMQATAPIVERLRIFNLFLLGAIITVLPVSTVIVSERSRLIARLRTRNAVAQQARLRAEDAAAARSRFLAMMSHEMRTPLNCVTGFADLLSTRAELDEVSRRQARQIREASDGLLVLVEDILNLARGDDDVVLRPEVLKTIVEDAATPSLVVARDKGLVIDVQDRLPVGSRFDTDHRLLRQALQALIGNAVKFTHEGGVTISLDHEPPGVIAIRIADTGPGLGTTRHAQLFEIFEQADASIGRSHSGAGLGLAIAMRATSQLNGALSVESEPGESAVFCLRIPASRAPDAVTEEAPDPFQTCEDEGRAPVVLVVDDHPTNREVARVMLTTFGCDVVEACDGCEAVDAVAREAFDLILMDVRMPRMDGLEATRQIRASGRSDLAIVAMTADAMPEDVARCLDAGMNAHMAKPISQAGLLAMLNRVLSGDLPEPGRSDAIAA